MALGSLFLLFVFMVITAIVSTTLLFSVKNEKANDIILVLMTAYSLFIAYTGAMSQPINFVFEQILCWVIGVVAIIGTALRFTAKKQLMLSKILVTFSVIYGTFKLFF